MNRDAKRQDPVWLWTVGPALIEPWAAKNKIPVSAVCTAEQLIDFYGIRNVMYFDGRPHTPETAGRFAAADRLVLSLGRVLGVQSGNLTSLGPCRNLTGGMIDDLSSNMPGSGTKKDTYDAETVGTIYRHLKAYANSLRLYAVIYTMNFNLDFRPFLPFIDVVSLWVWQAKDLADIDRHLERCREIFPGKPINLGLYLYQYPARSHMPLDLVQFEFRKARDYVQRGLIEGYQVLGSYFVEELAMPHARWVRDFVKDR